MSDAAGSMKQTDGTSTTNAGGASVSASSTGNAPNVRSALEEKIRLTTMAQLNPALSLNRQALPDPTMHAAGALPENSVTKPVEERIIKEVTERLAEESHIRVHYYVKIVVSVFLCALLLAFGIPVFMASRMTGSLSYTALGTVLIGFGLILAISVVVLLFKPPFNTPKA